MANVTFKGKPIKLAGSFPSVHQKAPDFLLVNERLENKSLQDFPRVKKLLLIVPSLETPVCSMCTKTFHNKVMGRNDLSLLVISADLPFAQKRYCATEKVSNLTVLSTMRGHDFGRNYGVLIQEGPLEGLCARAVLLLDPDNVVLYGELVAEITQEPNYEKVFTYL